MITTDFFIEAATWDVDAEALRAVRTPVFVIEQNVPEDEEWDELDARSHHVIARDPSGRPIGTGRLTPLKTIGRMAVVADWRGRGVGKAILRVLLERARELRHSEIEIHAQSHALAFYREAGFEVFGEEFDECGIAHRHMRIQLDTPVAPQRAAVNATDAISLLSSDRDQTVAAMLTLIQGARRELLIRSRDLDPGLLDRPEVIEAIKRMLLATPHARLRILVQEPARAASEGHPLLTLAQRLSSAITFRTPVDEIDHHFAGAFLLNDRGGWFRRPLASRFDGDGSSYAPGRHAQLAADFEEVWERSEPSVGLRRLDI